ncbi:VOC family protein [Nocardioides sp. YIM 152588]|uniref:VOC family protein n=1 Tax=Nocardioides sp. YIM 152588 TaxID=3158259 RepID=UPI0032E4E3A3
MLDESRQVGFLGVSDLDAAERFYGGVLGLTLEDARPFALVHRTATSQLRITHAGEVAPAPYTVHGWEVEGIEDAVDRLVAAGVELRRYDGLGQDERGIWTAPGGTRIAWFADPDGNVLSLQE